MPTTQKILPCDAMTKIWQAFSLPDFIINQYNDTGALSAVLPMIEKKDIVQTPKIGGLTFNDHALAIYWVNDWTKDLSVEVFTSKSDAPLVQLSIAVVYLINAIFAKAWAVAVVMA